MIVLLLYMTIPNSPAGGAGELAEEGEGEEDCYRLLIMIVILTMKLLNISR